MDDIISKYCPRCGKTKLLDEFYNATKGKFGKTTYCKPCTYDHTVEWRNNNREKTREQVRRYYRKHKDERVAYSMKRAKENPKKHNAYVDRWHKNNHEKGLKASKKWRDGNKEKGLNKQRRWRKNNPIKARLQVERRRARKENAEGDFTAKEWKDLCKKYGNRCLCCGKKKKLTMDHIVPLCKGGSNKIDNIQPLCLSCNSIKNTKIIDYRQ